MFFKVVVICIVIINIIVIVIIIITVVCLVVTVQLCSSVPDMFNVKKKKKKPQGRKQTLCKFSNASKFTQF